MKKLFIIVAFIFCYSFTVKAQLKTENIVIVTLDGMRWQEVFSGADSIWMFGFILS